MLGFLFGAKLRKKKKVKKPIKLKNNKSTAKTLKGGHIYMGTLSIKINNKVRKFRIRKGNRVKIGKSIYQIKAKREGSRVNLKKISKRKKTLTRRRRV
jgi:hypothetical protein